ncbi:hypothetical protein ACFXAZ_38950 [Streptomyces sp. NPDC059477]|uniref:hypothetical protein n=1 Tax=Streptomyces sp. NPDC059477 TaxID=3346847 RepID=UPI0036A700B3
MTRTAHDITGEAAEVLALPPLASLTADQARGAVCVWDATEQPLTGQAAVDLGERQDDGVHWFPRACPQHTGEQAYRALHDHAPACRPCIRDAGSCPVGIALRRLMKDGRRTT